MTTEYQFQKQKQALKRIQLGWRIVELQGEIKDLYSMLRPLYNAPWWDVVAFFRRRKIRAQMNQLRDLMNEHRVQLQQLYKQNEQRWN